jgi:hypothetical protein
MPPLDDKDKIDSRMDEDMDPLLLLYGCFSLVEAVEEVAFLGGRGIGGGGVLGIGVFATAAASKKLNDDG